MVSPGVAFAKKILLQRVACQSACEVTGGDMFSDGLTYGGDHARKPLLSMSGQELRERRPA